MARMVEVCGDGAEGWVPRNRSWMNASAKMDKETSGNSNDCHAFYDNYLINSIYKFNIL